MDIDHRALHRAFTQTFPQDTIAAIVPLAGQASSRRYFRLTSGSGKTYVLMQLPAGEKGSISEEAMGKTASTDELPFVAVQRYLRQAGVAVPEIYFYIKEAGQLLLEDIGDRSLEQAVRGGSEASLVAYYKKAIDALIDWQQKTTATDRTCIAFARAFDFELLYWECEHFLEYGAEDYFARPIPQESRRAIEAEFSRLCRELVALPQTLVHRDFQSRNLHFHDEVLKCIDFQDALVGPFVYDLVALLRDSYIVLSAQALATLRDYYWQQIAETFLCDRWSLDRARFDRAFNLQTVQRKLKDAGRFQYIYKMKNNDQFLPYRSPSLDYVRHALAALPDYARLLELLSPWMAEA